MKKTILMIAVLTFLSLLAFSQDKDYYSGSFVRLTYVKGDVVVQKAGGLGSEAAVANLVIVEGDQVETKGGRAEISFGRKNYLRVDNGTLVEFSNLPRKGDDRVRIHLLSGNIYLRVGRLEVEKSFEVHTPDASFYVLEEGLFRFDARGGGETVLSVLEGSVEAAGEAGSQLIGSRETLMAANGQLGSQGSLSYSKDEFDYWNEDRDALQSQYVSKRYLPSELEDYESELADNGYWTYENPYGYVWVPYVHSYADWRPYYYGYWDWYPLCGWTWIPYETWGWSVYHYGRWGWRFGLGWYWIPHYAWGPAWVHWYWGYDYWGWCPLSWYNYPCVVVNNYFYDRYHGNYYPGNNHALTVVHRDQLRNRNIHEVALSRSEASRLENITMQAQQPDVQPGMLKQDLRNVDGSNAAATTQPSVNPSGLGRGEGGQATEMSTRLRRSSSDRSSSEQGQVVSRDQPSVQGSRVTSDRLSQGQDRSVSSYRSSSSAERQTARSLRSRSESAGSASSSPRQIRSYESRSNRTSATSPSTIRSYSSSSRASTSDGARSTFRSSSSRTYAPSSSITRYGSSYSSSSSRRQNDSSYRTYSGSSSRSSTSSPRSSYSSRGYTAYPSRSDSSSSYSSRSRSYSGSSSRSVFSAPRSSSSSRRYSSSSPSRSGSSSSYSSRSRSYSGSSSRSVFSAPRSSSSSRSSSYSSPSRSRSSSSYSSGSRSSSSRSSSSRSSSSSSRSSSSSSRSHSGGSVKRKG